ncbi:MAG: CAAX prenyl protease-related protein [Bryobacterales bacterium]|nr:CAAX prenyl protease-related protein [Bryobacterales bacterium]
MNKLLRPARFASPSWPYVLPFASYLLMLAAAANLPGGAAVHYPLRVAVVAAVLLACSRPVLRLKPSRWFSSAMLGVAVFLAWIAPDLLWPAYRSHWLLQNPLTGAVASSISSPARSDPWFLAVRVSGAVLLVPIVEELFWRAWMLRYIVSRHFERLPMGTATAASFWLTAFLFASEHGPYWDVGLAAGIAYNWWMMRTRSLADCILAHAVTNACLAAYVLAAGRWQYWL